MVAASMGAKCSKKEPLPGRAIGSRPGGYYQVSMIFRFQIEVAPGSWLDFGTAEGAGLHPVGSAIHELLKLNRGTLKAGHYRYRAVDGVTHDWTSLTLDSTWGNGRTVTDRA